MNYDPNKRYFGPQGNWLSEIIPPFPKGMPQLRHIFNYAGYNHDNGYTGKRRSGFFGKITDAWERYQIDKEFLRELEDGIKNAFEARMINADQYADATMYARTAYAAVRAGGWAFFRTSEEPV